MESFERYAGCFPEAAVAMMRRGDAGFAPGAAEPMLPVLPGGPWADAVLPEVMGYPESTTVVTPLASAEFSDALASMGRRIRALFVRA